MEPVTELSSADKVSNIKTGIGSVAKPRNGLSAATKKEAMENTEFVEIYPLMNELNAILESENLFPVSLDFAWPAAGYSKKSHAKDRLMKTFTNTKEYRYAEKPTG